MDPRQTISAVAAKTGFTPSALRFYEDAGLVTPARTAAGYRVYDDRTVERIRFIARAKQLGLTLDEITEFVTLWDGEHCAPVAGRLGDLVDKKVRETRDRITGLTAFIADLERARGGLLAAADEPCGDGCACLDDEPVAVVAVALSARPPIACTLAPQAAEARMGEWQRLLERSVGRRAVADGVALRFPNEPGLAAEVTALAAAEQSCCAFFTFTLTMDHTGTELIVSAPPDAAHLVDVMFGGPA